MIRYIAAAILAVSGTLLAEHPFGGTLPASMRAPWLAQILQADPQKRAASIVRLRADGKETFDDVKAAVAKAEPVALGVLRRLLQMVRPTDQSFVDILRDCRDWKAAADAARAIVLLDHHKDAKKFAEMDKAFALADRAHKKLSRVTKPGSPAPAVQILDAIQWIAQTHREQNWSEGKDTSTSALAIGDVAKTEGVQIDIEKFTIAMEPFIALREYARIVSAAHAQMRTAKSEAVAYAEILNERRVILGLRPLLLGEKLSAAGAQHSEEMVKLKYFAHESPVAANKSPWDRVRNAAFEGNGGGECIYAGGQSAQDAHKGWWYSDGHRLILYSEAQAQGIAKFGNTWTFLTGNFTKFPF